MGNPSTDFTTDHLGNSVAMVFILDESTGEIIDLWASSAESEEQDDTNKTKKDDDNTVQG